MKPTQKHSSSGLYSIISFPWYNFSSALILMTYTKKIFQEGKWKNDERNKEKNKEKERKARCLSTHTFIKASAYINKL